MVKEVASGVNEQKLATLIAKIQDDLEKLEKRFNQLETVIDSTKTFFKSDSASRYRNSYESMKYNFSIVKKNILSYTNDLTKVKNSYKKFETEAAATVNAYAREKESQKNERRI